MQRIDDLIARAAIDRSKPDWRTRLPRPAAITFAPGESWRARMVTSKGEVVIRLLPDVAPMHVTSFFDGLTFHRVIPEFMAQGGCPLGTGTGGPGYKFDGEYSKDVRHDRGGLLSMANAGPGTDGSQFFLTFVPTPWLDGKHTIFGQVEGGEAVLQALEKAGSSSGKTSEKLGIEKVRVEVQG
jgi:cyclophilin family peptidyl-prolyl cis-trans isomerase